MEKCEWTGTSWGLSPWGPSMITTLSMIFLLGLCVGSVIMSYRGAARDLKKFPGLKGPRDGKGNC